jgi:hypothetical protein
MPTSAAVVVSASGEQDVAPHGRRHDGCKERALVERRSFADRSARLDIGGSSSRARSP